jgi:hypothetical protein
MYNTSNPEKALSDLLQKRKLVWCKQKPRASKKALQQAHEPGKEQVGSEDQIEVLQPLVHTFR